LHPVTSGYYSCANPVFDVSGKYLFVTTSQSFNPLYSDLDNTFIYPNSTRLAAIVLKKTTPSPLYPKDDTVAIQKEDNAPAAAASGKSKPPATPPPSKPAYPRSRHRLRRTGIPADPAAV
jgi:tricorn protease